MAEEEKKEEKKEEGKKENKEKEEKKRGKKIGVVTHYFDNISVAIVKLEDTLAQGERIRVKGHTTDFEQEADSIQVDHANINEAKSGDEIGMKVSEKTREGDEVYKVS